MVVEHVIMTLSDYGIVAPVIVIAIRKFDKLCSPNIVYRLAFHSLASGSSGKMFVLGHSSI